MHASIVMLETANVNYRPPLIVATDCDAPVGAVDTHHKRSSLCSMWQRECWKPGANIPCVPLTRIHQNLIVSYSVAFHVLRKVNQIAFASYCILLAICSSVCLHENAFHVVRWLTRKIWLVWSLIWSVSVLNLGFLTFRYANDFLFGILRAISCQAFVQLLILMLNLLNIARIVNPNDRVIP